MIEKIIKGILGPIGAYDADKDGFQERGRLPMFEGCAVAEGVTLGKAPCRDDMEGNYNRGTPII